MALLTHLTILCSSCLKCKREAAVKMIKLNSAFYHSTSNCMANLTSNTNVPVIRLPVKLQSRIRKLQKAAALKDEERRIHLSRLGNLSKPIVSCRRPQFNYYEGQTFNKFQCLPLTSGGWKNRKSAGDTFTVNRFDRKNHSFEDEDGEEKKTFKDLSIRQELCDRLEELNIKYPSKIQSAAIQPILRGFNTMCAAETGSGKTLAYLLPIVQQVLIRKEMPNFTKAFNSPSALILVPNRELASQIYDVIKDLTKSLPISSSVLVGGAKTRRFMLRPAVHEVDILVSSLGVIKKLVSSGIYSRSKLKHVVVDESDSLLDDSFSETMLEFLEKITFRDNAPSEVNDPEAKTQLTLIGATLPANMEVILKNIIQVKSVVKITTQHLHRLMGHVQQTFLRLKHSNKPAKLLELVKNDIRHKRPVMIFSKNSATADYINIFLEENSINSLNFHSKMTSFWREGRFEKFQKGEFDAISCTDIASRGLDTARVRHIINYDFPVYISDYIHRVGRVGRLSSVGTCKVTNFITTDEEVELVQKIETAAKKMETFSQVDANIKHQIVQKISALQEEEFL
ncbi:hypothetical protein CHUAL_004296 [Chamberlinius hualienensis]